MKLARALASARRGSPRLVASPAQLAVPRNNAVEDERAGSGAAARCASTDSCGAEARAQGSSLPFLSAAVLIERLPVVMPKPPRWYLEYQQFSFDRSQQRRKAYPAEFLRAAVEPPSDETKRAVPEGQVDIQTTTDLFSFFDDPSRTTPLDASNNERSLQRALDKRLYLLIKGRPQGKAPPGVTETWASQWQEDRWRLPEKAYSSEDSLRQCAEDAVSSVLATDPADVYFVGNAPFAHVQAATDSPDPVGPKRFFFWANWLGQDTVLVKRAAADFAWLTRDEALARLEGSQEREVLDALLAH